MSALSHWTSYPCHDSQVVDKCTSPFLPPPPKIDDKTIKRLQNVKSAPHNSTSYIYYLFYPIYFPHLVHYLFTIMTTWPSSRDQSF